jgi:ABC-type nitrate/sulfonate/bicarbonate transport system permease component
MDNFLWGFTIGIFAGVMLGVTIMAVMSMAKAADEAMNRWKN